MSIQYKALSIAGFDGSGGAGIQADLKAFSALGCYGMTVLTALPVQNTCGVRNCYPIPTHAIVEQLEAIFDDIRPDSIKIGMLFNAEIIQAVSDFLSKEAKDIPIVLDPVMVAKSGAPLLQPEAVSALKENLIPLATLITPNLPEAIALVGNEGASMAELAEALIQLGSKAVLLKGGHAGGDASDDLLCLNQEKIYLSSPRIETKNTHGTGCTLSAAIASFLAQGFEIQAACEEAKAYLYGAIAAGKEKSVGKGYGPVHHFYLWW